MRHERFPDNRWWRLRSHLRAWAYVGIFAFCVLLIWLVLE
jgi:hypothetical protein